MSTPAARQKASSARAASVETIPPSIFGILARLAIDPNVDSDLTVLDASHLFEGHTTWIGFRRSALLRAYMYEFIELLAPQLTRKLVRETEKSETQEEVDRILHGLPVPLRDNP